MDRYPSNLPIIERTRSEVLSGPERRRRWTLEQKTRIVAESLAPDAVAREGARRHGVHPNQRYGWRREVRENALAQQTDFVPVAVATEPTRRRPGDVSVIELRIGDAEMRIGPDVDPTAIRAAIRALRGA